MFATLFWWLVRIALKMLIAASWGLLWLYMAVVVLSVAINGFDGPWRLPEQVHWMLITSLPGLWLWNEVRTRKEAAVKAYFKHVREYCEKEEEREYQREVAERKQTIREFARHGNVPDFSFEDDCRAQMGLKSLPKTL